MERSIDRRNFIKGALATGALAAGGAALAGCSPAKSADEGKSAATSETSGSTSSIPKGLRVLRRLAGRKTRNS